MLGKVLTVTLLYLLYHLVFVVMETHSELLSQVGQAHSKLRSHSSQRQRCSQRLELITGKLYSTVGFDNPSTSELFVQRF